MGFNLGNETNTQDFLFYFTATKLTYENPYFTLVP